MVSRRVLVSAILGTVTASAAAGLSPVHLGAPRALDGVRPFIDGDGRELMFHGTNAVVKGPPWVPMTTGYDKDLSMTELDFKALQQQGVNALRLGVMWPGVEPVQGQYNETYLDEIDKIVRMAAAHGVYTLLDMHQDGLTEFSCGEGIPTWAVRHTPDWTTRPLFHGDFPSPFDKLDKDKDYFVETALPDAPRLPTRQACATKNKGPGWYELTEASSNSYEALWTNVDGIVDLWGKMWAHVASRFKGRAEVLGLELINEPFNGDLYANPLIMVPGHENPLNADRTRLEPAYDILNKAIRAADPNVLVFFAGVTSDDIGPGFDEAPGGAEYANRSVLAYHFYSPPQLNGKTQMLVQRAGAKRLGTGAFLTESGMLYGPGQEASEEALQGWLWWEYKSFCRDDEATSASKSQFGVWGACKTGSGGPPPPVRPYASAVSGTTQSVRFDSKTKQFTLKFSPDSRIAVPSEIRLSPATYPNGFNADVTPSTAAKPVYDPAVDPTTLRIVAVPGSPATNVTVVLTSN